MMVTSKSHVIFNYTFEIYLLSTSNTLHVHPGSSEKEIRDRYKKLALRWHPDKNFKNPDDAQKVGSMCVHCNFINKTMT